MQFLSFGLVSSVAIAIVLIVILMKAVKFVPQNRAFVVERFGKYTRTLEAGLNFLNPFFDRVSYNGLLPGSGHPVQYNRHNFQIRVKSLASHNEGSQRSGRHGHIHNNNDWRL